jgi:hypothetical protein
LVESKIINREDREGRQEKEKLGALRMLGG